MKNFYHTKVWNLGMTQAYVYPPPIPPIKGTCDGKSNKYFVKLKFCRDHTSSTSDLYYFRMYLFDDSNPEEFLLFVRNFNMTLVEIGILETGANIQYLLTLVHGEALFQFDSLYADVESTETLNVEFIIKGLALYFPL